MRRLTDIEESALEVLRREGSVLISDGDLPPGPQKLIQDTFDALVKKKRAVVEVTDGGNRYHAA